MRRDLGCEPIDDDAEGRGDLELRLGRADAADELHQASDGLRQVRLEGGLVKVPVVAPRKRTRGLQRHADLVRMRGEERGDEHSVQLPVRLFPDRLARPSPEHPEDSSPHERDPATSDRARQIVTH